MNQETTNMICWCGGTFHLLCYHRNQENQEDEEVICIPDIPNPTNKEDTMDITDIFDITDVPSVSLADIASLTNMTISNINTITDEVAKEMHIHEDIPEDPTDPTKIQHLIIHQHKSIKMQEPRNQGFVTLVFNHNKRKNTRTDTPTSHLDSYPVNSHNKGTGVSTKFDDIHTEVTPVAKVDPR